MMGAWKWHIMTISQVLLGFTWERQYQDCSLELLCVTINYSWNKEAEGIYVFGYEKRKGKPWKKLKQTMDE
jgi:hypothetical protein